MEEEKRRREEEQRKREEEALALETVQSKLKDVSGGRGVRAARSMMHADSAPHTPAASCPSTSHPTPTRTLLLLPLLQPLSLTPAPPPLKQQHDDGRCFPTT